MQVKDIDRYRPNIRKNGHKVKIFAIKRLLQKIVPINP